MGMANVLVDFSIWEKSFYIYMVLMEIVCPQRNLPAEFWQNYSAVGLFGGPGV